MTSGQLTPRAAPLGSAAPSVSLVVSMHPVGVNALARFFFRPAGRIARREYVLGVGLILSVNLAVFSFLLGRGEPPPGLVFFLAVLENFGYRQLVTFWRVRGTLRFFRGEKAWGEMERRGFGASVEVSAP